MSKTKQEVIAIAQKYGLKIKEESLEFNESGLDFSVVFGLDENGKEWVLRFPRRDDVVEGMASEKKILDLVNAHVQFEVPNWEIFESDLIAYKKLSGVPLGIINIEIQNFDYAIDINNLTDNFFDSLGKVLFDLHSIPIVAVAKAGFEVVDIAIIRKQMSERIIAVKNAFGMSDVLNKHYKAWLANDELWQSKSVFIHGEVHPGHIIIDKGGTVTGLIDWTESKVGDIAYDFIVFYKLLGKAGVDKLVASYKKAGGYTWDKMTEHIIELAATEPIIVAEFALKSGLEEYSQVAKQMLGEEAVNL